MTSLNLNISDRISAWNQQDEYHPSSNNMLRVLQSKIMNSVRPQQKLASRRIINIKSDHIRPATVRVRPISPIGQGSDELLSHPTIEIHDLIKIKDNKFNANQTKIRNKSLGNYLRNKIKNKQNQVQKQQNGKEKQRNGCLQMKKQQLIFHYQSLKPKKSQKMINNFHEMEIKLRKNRTQNNKTALNHKQNQFQIVFEPNGKRTDIKIISSCGQSKSKDQNLFQIGLEKVPEGQYTKLTRKHKILIRQKFQKKQIKKQKDLFSDVHFTDQQSN